VPDVQSRLLEDAMAEMTKCILHVGLTERCYHSDGGHHVAGMSESAYFLKSIVVPMLDLY